MRLSAILLLSTVLLAGCQTFERETPCRALEKPPRTIHEVWKRQAESVRNWILNWHAKDAK